MRVIVFTALAYGLAWAWWWGLMAWSDAHAISTIQQALVPILIALGMFAPTLAMVLTRVFTRQGWSQLYFLPRPGGWKTWAWLAAWLGTTGMVALGAVLYFLLVPNSFSLSAPLFTGADPVHGSSIWDDSAAVTAGIFVMSIFLAPILNLLPALGEEWGWRGYLNPQLDQILPRRAAVLATGVIWGLWHLPLTLAGHNYGLETWGFPYTNVLAMVLFCVTFGVFFSYLAERTGSALAPAIAHATLNGIAGGALYFAASPTPFLGPAPTGAVGALPFIAVAAILLWRAGQGERES